MDKLKKYKDIIEKELSKWKTYTNSDMPDVKYELLTNEEQNNFILYVLGWHKKNYFHDWVYHVQIVEDKIWIHEDRTDDPIADILVDKGIEKSDIVLGYLAPLERKWSAFAESKI